MYVALVIQQGKDMCRIIVSPVACLPQFSTLSQKRQGFRKKKSLNTKCVFRYYLLLLSENFPHSKNNSVTYYHKCTRGLHICYTLFQSHLMKLEFSRHIFSRKSVQCEPSCFMWTDGRQTDMMKLTVAICNVTSAPKNHR